MPKRPCPFEDSFSSQHKVHVHERLVNEGVMSNKNMKKVYDHTLKMLFSGSRQTFKNNALDCLNNNTDKCSQFNSKLCELPSQTPLRQLEITSQGKLLRSNNNGSNVEFRQLLRCKVCSEKGTNVSLSCGYCDAPLCDLCIRLCIRCQKGFCNPCSFTEYGNESERVICLSCI